MRRISNVLALLTICLISSAYPALAETVVLDFEDLPGGYTAIPEGYGGIADWDGWTTFDVADENYQPSSGDVRCLAFSNGPAIQFGQEYVFDGVWISGPVGPPEWVVWYELYLQGVLVHTSEGMAPEPTPAFNPSGYDLAVDEVRIIHTFTNLFCIDDFTYTTTTVGNDESSWGSVKSLYR